MQGLCEGELVEGKGRVGGGEVIEEMKRLEPMDDIFKGNRGRAGDRQGERDFIREG